jgi:hypothetical protein
MLTTLLDNNTCARDFALPKSSYENHIRNLETKCRYCCGSSNTSETHSKSSLQPRLPQK